MPPYSALQFRVLGLFVALLLTFALTHPLFAQVPSDDAEIREQLALAEGLLGKTPDRAAVLYFIAGSYSLLQEPHEAISRLQECIAAKEGFEPSGDRVFAGLKTSPDFQKLVTQARGDFPVVTHAKLAFVFPEKDLIPEGLAYESLTDSFLMSSLHLKKIVRIPRDGREKYSDFVASDRYHLLPVLGIRIDPNDQSIWSASWLDNGPTELLHFDKSGMLLGRFSPPGEAKHGLNDLVVLKDGTVYVTDTAGNLLFRFTPKDSAFHEVKLSRPLLMPNGIAVTDDGNFIYVADQLGVLRLEVFSDKSEEVSPGTHSTLAGADGLYWHKGSLIAVQNGIGSPRVATFQLAPDGLHVTKTTVLENRSAFSVLPTTGAIRGDDFYFMANSQLENLNGDRIMDPTLLEPVRVGVLTLP
jgi:hypothetical protein